MKPYKIWSYKLILTFLVILLNGNVACLDQEISNQALDTVPQEVQEEDAPFGLARSAPSDRIQGGEPAPPHAYPSIVVLNVYGKISCGGSIYNSRWVLSAGHCVSSLQPGSYTFVAGEHDRSKKEGTEQTRKAVELIRHEDFDKKTLANDIALWKLDQPFNFNDAVQPARLAPNGWNEEGSAIPVGWGSSFEDGDPVNVLQHVTLAVVPNDVCRSQHSGRRILDTHICAGLPEGGKDACYGDSGGPLYFRKDDHFIQIGITSWGVGCGRKNKPGVYTRISEYLSWIRRHAGEPRRNNGSCTKSREKHL